MRKIAAVGVVALIAACQGPTVTTDNCPLWVDPIYASPADTPETLAQVDEHNIDGEEAGCWEPPVVEDE
jgi:hypothetical protein